MEIESVLPGLLENKLGANLLLFLVLLVILKFFLGEAQQVALELLVFLQLILDLIQVLFGVSLELVVDHRLKLGLKGLGVILLPISVSLGLSLHFFVVFDQLVQVVFCFTFQFFLLALTQLFEHFWGKNSQLVAYFFAHKNLLLLLGESHHLLRIHKELLEHLQLLVLHLSHFWRFHVTREVVEALAIFVSSCKDTILTKLVGKLGHPRLNLLLLKQRELVSCHIFYSRISGLVDSSLHVLRNRCITKHPRS